MTVPVYHSLMMSSNDYYDSEPDFVHIMVTPKIPTPPAMPTPGDRTTYLAPMIDDDDVGMFYVKVPNMRVKITTFIILDLITLAFFTVDLVLRLLSCPCIFRYFTSIINIADAAALISTYIHMIIIYMYTHRRYEDEWTNILEYMQMLRSLRLFRLISNVRAGRVLAFTVKSNAKDLLIIIMFLIAGMCTFASVFYMAEKSIEDIPHGWYWAVVTMTTVGYGDIVPHTAIGRLLSCACAVCGVLMFSMTVPIFANHFITLYQYIGCEGTVRKEIKKRRSGPVLTVSGNEQPQA